MMNSKHLITLAVCSVAVSIQLHFSIAQLEMIVAAQLPVPNVEAGSSAYFYCFGPGGIRWYKLQQDNSEVEITQGGRFDVSFVLSDGVSYVNMTINNVVRNDSGHYMCKDNRNAFDVTLTVYEVRDVVISPAEPKFVQGSNLLLNCTVDGTTDQTVSWSVNKGDSPVELTGGYDTSHVQVFDNGSLIVRDLTSADAGVYICTHYFDEASKSAEVIVGGEITIKAEKSVKYTEGDRALIECEADFITPAWLPTITWLVNGENLEDACPERCTVTNTTTTHTVTSKLEIVKITMEDRKNYTCIATNAAYPEGVSTNILLRVRDRLHAAIWPILGIVMAVIILIIIIFIYKKCSKGEASKSYRRPSAKDRSVGDEP